MYPIYTLGYQGRKPADILRFAEEENAMVFDIRYRAASRHPQWSKSRLDELLGSRYEHVNDLGNVNYRGDGPIQLKDYARGREAVRIVVEDQAPVFLMCVCKDPAECHRTVVAERLRAEGFEVKEWESEQLARWKAEPLRLGFDDEDGPDPVADELDRYAKTRTRAAARAYTASDAEREAERWITAGPALRAACNFVIETFRELPDLDGLPEIQAAVARIVVVVDTALDKAEEK